MNPKPGEIWKNKKTGRKARVLSQMEWNTTHYRYTAPIKNDTWNRPHTAETQMQTDHFIKAFEKVTP